MDVRVRYELEQLYREEGAKLWRAILLLTRDREMANDVVAEAFAQALARGEAIRSPRAWVWTVAFRLAAAQLKVKDVNAPSLPEGFYEMSTSHASLFSALGQLSASQQRSVILHYYGGYSQREIAAMIGSSTSAVGVHLHRARRRLRGLLGDSDA